MKMKYLTLLCIASLTAATQAALVGFWDFEGGSATTLTDQSGNGNDATVNAGGTLQYSVDTPLSSGSSLVLDGTPNTAAEAPSSASLSISGDLTLVAWVKLDTAETNAATYQVLSKSAPEYRWNITNVNPTNGNFNQTATIALDTDLKFTAGNVRSNWFHIAMVYDEAAQTKTYYRNGSVTGIPSVSTNALVGSTNTLYIGAISTNESFAIFDVFNGLMDDVAVFDNALDGGQITSLANGSKTPVNVLIPDAIEPTYENLVGYWDFEDASSTLLHDQSGRGNQAVAPLGGMLTYSNNTPFGTGSSLALDGTDGWAVAANSDSLAVTGSLSMVAWVLVDLDVIGNTQILSKHHNAYRWRIFAQNVVNGSIQQRAWIAGRRDDQHTLGAETWIHLAVVYDAAAETKTFYGNGIALNTPVSSTNVLVAQTHNLTIGAFGESGLEVFDGLMDDLAIYSTALSAAQILSLADGTETPTSIVPLILLDIVEPTIIGVTAVASGVVERTIDAPSEASRYNPESRDSLNGGAWAPVPHSDNSSGPFVVSNLSYSTAAGTNEIIYIEATNAAAFFQIIGE